jgi:N-acetylmuramoyl-L-alanine amidase
MRYERPSLRMLALAAVSATLASALMAFSRPIEMTVDGQRVESDVPPVTTVLGDKVYVPVRSLADALGAQTSVEGQNIFIVRGQQSLRIRTGDRHASLNGMPLTLKHAPFRVRGRVMVGLKAFARIFGIRANYDPRMASVQVMTPGIGEAAEPASQAQAQ